MPVYVCVLVCMLVYKGARANNEKAGGTEATGGDAETKRRGAEEEE